MSAGRHIEIGGVVQGVGFRPWVYNLARGVGLTGWVSNDSCGVTIEAYGSSDEHLDAFVARLRTELPPAARIDRLTWDRLDPAGAPGSFEIAPSTAASDVSPSIPADLATCDACAREIADPSDRRYRYAFTSCTHCGPRFTIALGVPYDRATTTMAPFRMCERCQREYDDPTNRRFHAQPNACPECGPRLRLTNAHGQDMSGGVGDAILQAAALLSGGAIVAIKGLGGFHLACDATRATAVRELRVRKRRDQKPFAIMVRDLAAAEALARLNDAERALLTSPAHPIVLVRRRDDADVAREVAPDSDRLGIMLPYTPLHHVLLRDVAFPLVMTSGNLSDEPIATDDDDALARLGSIADAFLLHDREIASRADDSVAFVALGKPVVTRRSRGYVAGRIALPRRLSQPILACGAHLKNTFCIGRGDSAYFGPHIGDLDNLAALEGYERAIDRMEDFLQTKPEIVAHDLHPDYVSTHYALARVAAKRVAVQHHHAHVVSAMIEHGLEGPVIGVAFDGTGYGTDGTAWGGEILVATAAAFGRVASLRPVRLAGGDRAIREVWRTALALLDDAFDGDPPIDKLRLFDAISAREIALVRRMIETDTNAPLASGAGRYFDAFGAIGLARHRATYEGQVAMAWEQVAGNADAPAYPFVVDAREPLMRIDLRDALRAATNDVIAGRAIPAISARFHATLVAATADVVRGVVLARGKMPVVLTGGCFQNVRLTERLVRALEPDLRVFIHEQAPPGDGGVALGQLAVAAASLEGSSSSCA